MRLPFLKKRATLNSAMFSVADQGVYSAASFISNILLARWLSLHDYGAFALFFTLFLIIGTLHAAIIIEPMLIFGGLRFKESDKHYLRSIIYLHLFLTSAFALLGIVAAQIVPNAFEKLTLWLFINTPVTLLCWTLRKACYYKHKESTALVGSSINFIIFISCLIVCYRTNRLQPETFFIMQLISSTATNLFFIVVFSKENQSSGTGLKPKFMEYAKPHWRYGKWVLGGAALNILNQFLYVPLLAVTGSLSAAAQYKCAENLLLPLGQLLSSLSNVVLPRFAKGIKSFSHAWLRHKTHLVAFLFTGLSLLYVICITLLAPSISTHLYNGKYESLTLLVFLLGIPLILRGSRDCAFGNALRAKEQSKSLFYVTAIGTTVSLGIGIPLTLSYELLGATLSRVLIAISQTTITIFFFIKMMNPHGKKT